jgi:UV DNA damage endonuclease
VPYRRVIDSQPAQPAARIGYCCIYVPPDGDKKTAKQMNVTSTTITALSRMERNAVLEKLLRLVTHNIAALEAQLARIASLPVLERLLRLSSDMLPAYTHPVARWVYNEPDMRRLLDRGLGGLGALARRDGVRLSLHPGPFCVLATVNETTLRNAIDEFEYHTDVMRWLGHAGGWHPQGAHINIHVGSSAGGLDRFRAALPMLSEDARGLITVENDELAFGLADVLSLRDQLPVVLDFHHHWIASGGQYLQPGDPRIAEVKESWRGVRPVSHISVSPEAVLPEHPADTLPDFAALTTAGHSIRDLRAHSNTMWNQAVNALMAAHLCWTDIEVEAKHKNIASRQLVDHVKQSVLS